MSPVQRLPSQPGPSHDDDDLVARACALAGDLLAASEKQGGPLEHRREVRMRRVLTAASGTRLVFALADRALRPVDPSVGVSQLATVAAEMGADPALGGVDRFLLAAAVAVGPVAPRTVMALVAARMRHETSRLIWSLDEGALTRRLGRLRNAGRRSNLNLLGEAILGDAEAERRVTAIEALLGRPDVDCVSVKVSSVASSLSLLDESGSVSRIAGPLRRLYRTARTSPRHPMVNLDMEEHRDLDLTVAVFRRLLDEPEFETLEAGIALQAYLPDTHGALAELLEWSAARFVRTGAGIRIRLVKGANLAMERVEAELHG